MGKTIRMERTIERILESSRRNSDVFSKGYNQRVIEHSGSDSYVWHTSIVKQKKADYILQETYTGAKK